MNKLILHTILAIIFLTVSVSFASAVVLTKSKLSSEIEKQVISKLSKSIKGEVKAEALLLPVDVFEIPSGELDVIVDLDNNNFAPKKYANITIKVNGKKVKKFPTPIALTLYQNVWVATDAIARNQSLNEGGFTLEKKDVTRNYSIAITSDKDISDYVAIRNIRSGDVIDKRFVMPKPDIVKDSVVSVIFDTGGVNIAIEGESMQSGCIGDLIRVRNNQYKKCYIGKIISENKVLVKI